ncbi:uncharacterized protein LOC126554005 [Aphis gossypii]|uniref:uncharacterized protein LOC126554005 n=1 Tax=Aphis gossypii TaxID=80765 RepID=UPI0021592C7A|nr:uncharacterized protein LOC126554005 [Aphis gossypii]
MIMVIPLLPAQRIEEGFIEAKRYASMHNVNMLRLFNYYERYWLQNVGVEVLSVYKKKFRTNNNVESFHNKLRQMFQTSHPNIWVFLGNICKLIENYSIKLNQTDNGLVILHTKRAKYVANDKRIKSASHQLRQGLISVGTFLKRCSYSVAGYEERMRALAIGQIYNEAVENQVPQLLDIPNGEVLNHNMDGKYKMNLWFKT